MLNFGARFRLVARRLGRAPAFTAITILTLAIAIGANTAIFSVIDGVLLKGLPYSEPDRLVGVWHSATGLGIPKLNMSPSSHFTYRQENHVFEDIAMWQNGARSVTGFGDPERVDTLDVTYAMFPILRVSPAAGRIFGAQDDEIDSPETVMLSYGYWQRKFGGDRGVIGRSIVMDGKTREIVGVLPQHFRFLDVDADLFCPMRFDRAKLFVGNYSFQSVARLKPGVTLKQANADVERMMPIIMDRYPFPAGFTRQSFESVRMGADVHPLKEDVVGDVGKVLWLLMGTVGIVLLIACANVANLFLVRAEGRQHEFTVRAALGADRGRLAGEMLSESVALAAAGGLLGVGLAYAGLRLLVVLAPANLPRLHDIGIGPASLLFTLVISFMAGTLLGAVPILRFGKVNLGVALREGGRALSDAKGRRQARNMLAVAQIAMALVLLTSAGLMLRTFQALQGVDSGFARPSELLTFGIPVPQPKGMAADQIARTHQRILERLGQIPGVTQVAAASELTLNGNGEHDPILVEQFPTSPGELPKLRLYRFVSPGYFATTGNAILAGRDITWQEIAQKRPVVLVSENFARQYWKQPSEALGKRVRNSPNSAWREIVGVVRGEHADGIDKPKPQMIYWPLITENMWDKEASIRGSLTYALRSSRAETAALLTEVRQAVKAVDPALPVTGVRTMQKVIDRSMARTSFTMIMLAIASGMALLLGLVGIYGVISYSVAQRTREIGIRVALGAEHGAVRRMFVRHGVILASVGLLIGFTAAVLLTRWMSALLYGVEAVDPITYAAVGMVLLLATLLASYVPARRATTVDPSVALRSE
jgi:predicted permease